MCVLRASGLEFDPDAFVRTTSLPVCAVHRKGEPRTPRSERLNSRSGLTCDVSRASWSDLAGQAADAEQFLVAYETELRRLVAFPGVTGVGLDFPLERRNAPVQSLTLPASLVLRAGALGLSLEVTLYAPMSREPPPGSERRPPASVA